MSEFQGRIERAQDGLRERGLGAAVLAPTAQMRYLTGWAESGHERFLALILPARGEPAFVVPAINAEQARANPAGISSVVGWDDSEGWQASANRLLRDFTGDSRGLAIDDELDSVHLLGIQALLPGVRCEAAGELMARLREIKTLEELATMERSAALTDSVYEECLGAIREGMTEVELQDAVAAAYRRRGTKPEFALICFGPNSALPHHHSGAKRLERGDVVVMDIGCLLEDYGSDITRTVAYGEPGPEPRAVYDVVHAAHVAAFDKAAPGVSCEDVDAAARNVITKAGYGEQFIHRTGHGIGLSGHEPPYIVSGNRQELKPGMCFSDEPGIYLPGRFGVRIENIVTVTETGVRSLNADAPRELFCVGS